MNVIDFSYMAEPKEVEAIFVLADISGYTRFMISNQKALRHAQVIVSELIRTLIDQVKLPLKVAEIEGDAVFLYAVKGGSEEQWGKAKKTIGWTLENFSHVFYEKLERLVMASPCGCGACHNMEHLKIKVVAHSGKAIINKIDRFLKISGVDTIIAHRLLKNTVPSDDYMLVTNAAFDDLHFSNPHCFTPHQEVYDDVGTIQAMLCLTKPVDIVEEMKSNPPKFSLTDIPMYVRGGIELLFLKLGLTKPAKIDFNG